MCNTNDGPIPGGPFRVDDEGEQPETCDRRSQCKECHGSQICDHNMERSCNECYGSRVCEHNKPPLAAQPHGAELPGHALEVINPGESELLHRSPVSMVVRRGAEVGGKQQNIQAGLDRG